MHGYRVDMGRRPNPKIERYEHRDGGVTWRVRVRAGGRQTTETFDSEAAAKVFVSRVMDPAIGADRAVLLRSREDANSPDYVPTLREMFTTHVEQLTGVEGRTKDDYRAVAGRTWLKTMGSLRVDEITRADVAQWVNGMTGAPKSIKNAHSILSAVLESAVREGYAKTNPARGTRLPRAGEQDTADNRYLSHAEFDRLYKSTPEHYQPLVLLLFGTGLRWSEATALQVQDVDLEVGTLRVVRAWKKDGKSGWKIGPPKSAASRRTIALPAEVVAACKVLVLNDGGDERKGDEWLFTTSSGVAVRHNNFYNRIWKPACEAAKLAPRPRIHDARHTHASWLIAQGVRLEVVQDRLGHEDFKTTRKVYAHLMPDMLREAGLAASKAFAQTSVRALPPRTADPAAG